MAGQAEEAPNQELAVAPQDLKTVAARLYGQGFTRSEIAKALVTHLVPSHATVEKKVAHSRARRKLGSWEREPAFRKLIWDLALVQVDLQSGSIVRGVVQKAKRGRVDAAKFALELTGRYSPKSEQQPTQVAVVFTGINRSRAVAEGVIEAAPDEV